MNKIKELYSSPTTKILVVKLKEPQECDAEVRVLPSTKVSSAGYRDTIDNRTTVSIDLNRLKLLGVAGTEKTNDKLTRVGRIQFRWEGADAELLLDDICVQPEQAEENQNENASFFARLWTSLKEALAGLCARLRALFHIG